MKISSNFTTSIHLVLKELIETKSKRDQIKFTSSQLAAALCMPRSMITKLTHSDESKRVMNPRIDTLIKIVEFFRADGFNITIEDLLGTTKKNVVDIDDQKLMMQNFNRKIPIYPFNAHFNKKLGTIDIKIGSKSKNVIALYTDEDIKPFFKKGSIFIIDQDQNPEDETLIAVNVKNSSKIHIKKFCMENNKKILKSIDSKEKPFILSHSPFDIIGVVIQVNAKT